MDMETFETYELSVDQIGDTKYYLVEGQEVIIMMYEGAVLNVDVPASVALEVTETTPAIKGAPSTQLKDATVETGLTLKVPPFIEQGEKILVTTADGKYSGRA